MEFYPEINAEINYIVLIANWSIFRNQTARDRDRFKKK